MTESRIDFHGIMTIEEATESRKEYNEDYHVKYMIENVIYSFNAIVKGESLSNKFEIFLPKNDKVKEHYRKILIQFIEKVNSMGYNCLHEILNIGDDDIFVIIIKNIDGFEIVKK